EKKGFRFSLLNYTYGTNGIPVTTPNIVNLIDTLQIRKDLFKAKLQQTDAVIVFMHWGAEYQDAPNRAQKELAQFCLNNGATLVVGAHPHVLQPMQWNKEKNQLVAYSLGNFVSGQQSRYRDGGAMLWVEFEKQMSSDSVSSVRIKNASYELAWVYRNNEVPKKYFILPMKEFEQDTLLINNPAIVDRMKEFAVDSRSLYKKNIDIDESDRMAFETSYFKILLTTSSDSITIMDTTANIGFYGLYPEPEKDSLINWTTGKFYDREIAIEALHQIKSSTRYNDARLIWYYWDKRMEELSSGK
ncbi:MAG TPA: hypothetical protein DIW27_02075, partial [Cytophagales bacterium]|nr:hypothetical protein [Cytophagales bacterium]